MYLAYLQRSNSILVRELCFWLSRWFMDNIDVIDGEYTVSVWPKEIATKGFKIDFGIVRSGIAYWKSPETWSPGFQAFDNPKSLKYFSKCYNSIIIYLRVVALVPHHCFRGHGPILTKKNLLSNQTSCKTKVASKMAIKTLNTSNSYNSLIASLTVVIFISTRMLQGFFF